MPKAVRIGSVQIDAPGYLAQFQELLQLPRETVPNLTADATRHVLAAAAPLLSLELTENKGVAPIFALLPKAGVEPRVTLFASWHAETVPVMPAAVEGGERLALALTLSALQTVTSEGALGPGEVALVVAPGGAHGSLMLDPFLKERRARAAAPVGFWLRVLPNAPRRRRVFLGARGRVVIGLWGGETSPYLLRDQIIAALVDEAYGPRPLDFELIRKLAPHREVIEFLEETIEDPEVASGGDGEARLRSALFEPSAQIIRPGASHPDRPSAWITFETSEGMEGPDILRRVREAADGSRVEMAESMPWDRIGIHHPSIQSLIRLAKSHSDGPDLWPMSPWPTPSGVFTRALGVPLAEWGVPLPPGNAVRAPKPDAFEVMTRESVELILRATDALEDAA